MSSKYVDELEVQGAVEAYLTTEASGEYKNLSTNLIMRSHAELCDEARTIIRKTKDSLAESERQLLQECGDSYIEGIQAHDSEILSQEEKHAQEIETQAAVKAFFSNCKPRLYQLLGSADFFSSYTLLCERARSIISKEHKSMLAREQMANRFFEKDSLPIPSEKKLPILPEIELEVANTVGFYLAHDQSNYEGNSEEDFFSAYAKLSYSARNHVVEHRKDQNMTISDMLADLKNGNGETLASQFK